jgi:hypothetical protein
MIAMQFVVENIQRDLLHTEDDDASVSSKLFDAGGFQWCGLAL